MHSVIDELEFMDVSNDLYLAEEFSQDSNLIKTLNVGNKNFKLFSEEAVEHLRGTEFPEDGLLKG
jgi:hypothetical protein